MLKIYNSGFTLLGDSCQAIYDYQSKEMSSKEFYKSLDETFGNLIKIEYSKQNRLSRILCERSILLRSAIKSGDEKLIDNLVSIILKKFPTKEVKELQEGIILTRKNGKVYDISKNLTIKHSILDNSAIIYYPSWIGYVFGDYTEENINRIQFENIITKKLHITEKEKINEYWKYCKEIENSDEEILDIDKMHRNIIVSDNIEDENKEKNEKVILSTIHKAKGKEFKSVYLDKDIEQRMSKENIVEYAKLIYVAITRAKENCYEIRFEDSKYKKYYALMPRDERYLEFTYKNRINGKGHTKKSIKKIEIGLEKDIDKTSFINDRIVGNAKDNIEYIKNNVKKGDYVDLVLEKDQYYYIYHNKRKIGKMNIEDLYKDAQKYLNRVKKMTYNPIKYSEVRIKRVSTIAMFQEFIPSEIQNVYSKTGIWIGVELEGFGEIVWNNK